MQDIMQGRGSVKVSSGAVDGLCVGMLLAGGLRQIRVFPCVRSCRSNLGPKVLAALASLLA